MKRLILTAASLIFLLTTECIYSQNASTYFPPATGYKWYYSNTPLDSLNNPITSLRTYQVDSFAAVTNFQGLPANRVMSKTGLLSIGQPTPYTDSLYYNFQGTNGYYYLNVLSLLDSIEFLDSTFFSFLRSLDGWYNTYRFSQTVNTNYTIFSRDTTVTIDTLTLPVRVSSTGRRLNDQNISTVNGNYLAKKFIISFILSYGVTIPPFPTVYFPLVTRPDTVYIASGVWIVKDAIPSVNIDLTGIGFPVAFSIPGSVRELTTGPTAILQTGSEVPETFDLGQNFPNPFNPETKIAFSIPSVENVRIEVFDALGRSAGVLADAVLQAGTYEIQFDASALAGGVYFYTMRSGSFFQSRRMLLLK